MANALLFHEFNGVDISTRFRMAVEKFDVIRSHRKKAAATKIFNTELGIFFGRGFQRIKDCSLIFIQVCCTVLTQKMLLNSNGFHSFVT